jgi:hypothetical protein
MRTLLLTTRALTAEGFGAKRRDWNDRAELMNWAGAVGRGGQRASPELVKLGQDERGRDRFTTREMLAIERSMLERAGRLAAGHHHAVSARHREQVLIDGRL